MISKLKQSRGSACGLFVLFLACSGDAQSSNRLRFVPKEPTGPNMAAQVGDWRITEEELLSEDRWGFLEIEKRRYDLKMQVLRRIVEKRILEAEAKKAGLAVNEFIDKKIIKNYKDAAKDASKGPRSERTKRNEAIEAFLVQATKNQPKEVYFRRPFLVSQVNPGMGPRRGPADAKVQIVQFSDLQCEDCSYLPSTMEPIIKQYGKSVAWTFRTFPMANHLRARALAEAGLCLNEQSGDRFWRFHELVYKNQDKLDPRGLEKMVRETGADLSAFNTCVTTRKMANTVQTDFEYGEAAGVRSSPTFFVNGKLLYGLHSPDDLEEALIDAIEYELSIK